MTYEFEASRVPGDGNAVFPDELIIDTDEELVNSPMKWLSKMP